MSLRRSTIPCIRSARTQAFHQTNPTYTVFIKYITDEQVNRLHPQLSDPQLSDPQLSEPQISESSIILTPKIIIHEVLMIFMSH